MSVFVGGARGGGVVVRLAINAAMREVHQCGAFIDVEASSMRW
jgi:hypothetical protein